MCRHSTGVLFVIFAFHLWMWEGALMCASYHSLNLQLSSLCFMYYVGADRSFHVAAFFLRYSKHSICLLVRPDINAALLVKLN